MRVPGCSVGCIDRASTSATLRNAACAHPRFQRALTGWVGAAGGARRQCRPGRMPCTTGRLFELFLTRGFGVRLAQGACWMLVKGDAGRHLTMQSLATMATGSTNKQFLATWCGGGERSDLRIPRGSDSHRKGAFSDLGTHPPRIIPGLELMWPEQMYRSGRQVAPNPHLALSRSFTTSHRDTGCSIAELHSAHARVRVVGIYPGKHLPRPPSGETSGTRDTRIISERAGARGRFGRRGQRLS